MRIDGDAAGGELAPALGNLAMYAAGVGKLFEACLDIEQKSESPNARRGAETAARPARG